MDEGRRKKDYDEFYAKVYQNVYESVPCIEAAKEIFHGMAPMMKFCQDKCKEDEECQSQCAEQGLVPI